MDVWEAIQTKRAVREFTDEPLADEAVNRILSAGRRSQSSRNSQPWEFVVIRDPAIRDALATAGDYLTPLTRAALAIAIITDHVEPEHASWIAFDVGQCAAYMQLAAHEIGIGSVIGTVHRPEEARPILKLPEGKRVDVVLSFGYPTPHARRPLQGQGRRPLADIVHRDTWDAT